MGPRSRKPFFVTKICDKEWEAASLLSQPIWWFCVMSSHLLNQSYFWKSSTFCISLALASPRMAHRLILVVYVWNIVCFLEFAVPACELTSEPLVMCTYCLLGWSPSMQWRGNVARVAAAKAPREPDGRFLNTGSYLYHGRGSVWHSAWVYNWQKGEHGNTKTDNRGFFWN